MPTLNLTNLASCKSYFTTIATLHKEIDDFKWGNDVVVKKANRSDIARRVLWVKPYDSARYGGNATDNVTKSKVLELRYMLVATSQKQSDEEAAASAAEAVIEQILAKMILDKGGRENDEGEWEMIVLPINSIETENFEITIGSTRYIGCELKLTFLDNAHLEYDASKWNEPEP
jgi:hypothetical protein